MPTMRPYPISNSSPRSEKMFSETFRWTTNSVVKEWVIFHSFEVSNSLTIDFVMLDKTFLTCICLQVVSGTTVGALTPIDISKNAMHALQEKFSDYFGSNSRLALGHAAVFPAGTQYKANQLPNHLKEKFSTAAGLPELALCTGASHITCDALNPSELGITLQGYARDLHLSTKLDLFTNTKDWDVGKVELDRLEGEFESHHSKGVTTMNTTTIFSDNLETLKRELLRLTNEQFKSLELVNDEHNWRCVINGAAGTGKTVLAMELAKKRIELEETVALLCSNANLSRYFEKSVEKISNDAEGKGKIIAGTPATLPLSLFRNSNELQNKYSERMEESSELQKTLRFGSIDDGWRIFIPGTISDLQQMRLFDYFDYLIVDEAQNLCDPVFLELMDVLLKGGLSNGRWTMFGDFDNQDLVTLDRDRSWEDVLNGFTDREGRENALEGKWFRNSLITNCRNTHEIADLVFGLSRPADSDKALVRPLVMSGVHGPDVQIEYYEMQDELEKKLDKLIYTWKSEGLESRQIILLSSGTSDEFGTSHPNYGGWNLHNISDVPLKDNQSEILRYSDVYDFQGLESDLVILIMPVTDDQVVLAQGIILEQEQHLNRVLYTGMSRAKTMLIILAHTGYKRIIDRRLETWIEKKKQKSRKEKIISPLTPE